VPCTEARPSRSATPATRSAATGTASSLI
jgi:hypothetical protein